MRASLLAAGPFLAGVLAIIAMLAPIGPAPGAPVGPHLLLAALGFWLLRAPRFAPAITVFALGLALDLCRDGPAGVETFALLIIGEGLKTTAERLPAYTWRSETLRFAVAAAAFEAIVYAALALSLSPLPSLWDMATRWALTVAVFPLLGALQETVFGLRRGEDARPY